MARLDGPKVEELKQLLRRLERLAPAPDAAQEAASPGVSSPSANASAGSDRSLPSTHNTSSTILFAAAVSALLSTSVTVLVVRGMLATPTVGTESALPPQQDKRLASLPATQAGLAAQTAPAPVPAARATPAPTVNVDVMSNVSVATAERASGVPEPPPEPEPQNSSSTPAETEATPPQSIAEKAEEERAAPGRAPEPTVTASVSSPPAQATPDAAQYLYRGQLMLSGGNIGAARLLLERAAELGNGEAALVLGSTYDAARSSELRTTGLTPNAGLARRWYTRAAALGAEEARLRLLDLDKSAASPADSGK